MPLKVKLWLGRVFDWDKDGVRVVLVALVVCAVMAALIARDTYLKSGGDCNTACQERVDRAVDGNFPNVDRVIDDSFRNR